MANNKSAIKRISITKRNYLQNRFYKSSVKTLTKSFKHQLQIYKISKNKENQIKAKVLLNKIYSFIDKGYKKNIFHKNTAARKKSQLAQQLKNQINYN